MQQTSRQRTTRRVTYLDQLSVRCDDLAILDPCGMTAWPIVEVDKDFDVVITGEITGVTYTKNHK